MMTDALCLRSTMPSNITIFSTMPTKKESKKEIYRYDAAAVPDIMPFPALALVATTKGEEIPVPDLNDYQRSWIHDVALRDVDFEVELPTRAESTKFYDKVKMDAFEAKAFQHAVQPGDAAEEASLSKAIAKWKRDNVKKNKKTQNANDANDAGGAEGAGAADDAAGANEEEDEGARAGMLRGFPRQGWRLAIQKVISNKRTADKTRAAATKVIAAAAPAPIAPATALAKLMGLATYTARDKFRDERHAEIHEYSLTLAGANAGGNFRKAEALMWAKEDQAFWADAAAAEEEDVDWEARQGLIVGGFQHLVDTLSANPKFRPFVANISMGWLNEKNQLKLEWVETVPSGVKVRQRFEDQYKELTRSCLNAMYAWAEKPLQDYVATRDGSAAPAAPVFPHTAEALNDMSPNAVGQSIHAFLTKSYEAAFGNGAIPWAAIASAPSEYFDTEKFDVSFDSTGLESFQGKWHALGSILASGAGEGTSGFFRKVSAVVGEKEAEAEAERVEREKQEQEQERVEAERLERERVEREKQEQERVEAEQRERERVDSERLERERVEREKQEQERSESEQQERQRVESEQRERQRVESEQQERQRVESEQRERQRVESQRLERERVELERVEAERVESERVERERVEQMNGDAPGAGAAQDGKAKKGAKKRKAEIQLVPEDAGPSRRSGRTRQTAEEARLERQKKMAEAASAPKGKPSVLIASQVAVCPEEPGETNDGKEREENLSRAGTQVSISNSSCVELKLHPELKFNTT
ncbi:hypothetical protein B0H16DRAFT_1845749 [Mycena metata]|uniref:Uncharacterized protein n=1 Tax=Mycena metata TaxID=1033252 RepID=A0AAD7GGV0_9AGAR|nr:hypothetical protein B0H16DRAFT_1845749 [Mycena metata]